jgi:hypothetical protein
MQMRGTRGEAGASIVRALPAAHTPLHACSGEGLDAEDRAGRYLPTFRVFALAAKLCHRCILLAVLAATVAVLPIGGDQALAAGVGAFHSGGANVLVALVRCHGDPLVSLERFVDGSTSHKTMSFRAPVRPFNTAHARRAATDEPSRACRPRQRVRSERPFGVNLLTLHETYI